MRKSKIYLRNKRLVYTSHPANNDNAPWFVRNEVLPRDLQLGTLDVGFQRDASAFYDRLARHSIACWRMNLFMKLGTGPLSRKLIPLRLIAN
ncbi:hypothetical protein Zmor_012301 [Zophobas morio]|uniref:Uncharacterized protein n=1 Tax=Zophobas morio TaxID=2755281 RepID=A0AA38LYC7_9CUCU|nr:hypothetical protein Zmor_012301 [Zophobas morio]